MRNRLAAVAIPAALVIAAPAHADDAPNPNCAIGETEAAFAVNDLLDIAGDTGWFPANFVAQLRLSGKVQSHTNVSTAYRATTCWDGEMKAGLEGIPGSGYLDVAYGAEFKLLGRIHTTVLGYDIDWEDEIPIPWVPEDLLIQGAGTFLPRLDTSGVYVEDKTDAVTVLSTDAIAQFISIGGISGGLYVTVQGGMRSTYRAKKVTFGTSVIDSLTDQIDIAQPSGGFHSTVSLPLAIDGTIRYAPTLTFAAGLDVSIFGVRVVDWQFGSISMNLPGVDRNIKLTAQPIVVPLPELEGIGDGARMDFESASTQFLHIKNTGEGPLTLTPFAVPSGIQVVGVTLQGKDEADLRVTVSEGALAAGSTTLNFTTNDPDRPNVSIQLGMAVGGTDPGTPPVIEEPEAGGCSTGGGQGAGALLLIALACVSRRRRV